MVTQAGGNLSNTPWVNFGSAGWVNIQAAPTPAHRRQWETLNVRFHETLLAGQASPWTQKVLRLLSRHGERYRRYAMGLPGSVRDVHAEHTEICELALEAHIRATPDLLAQALRSGRLVLPGGSDDASAGA